GPAPGSRPPSVRGAPAARAGPGGLPPEQRRPKRVSVTAPQYPPSEECFDVPRDHRVTALVRRSTGTGLGRHGSIPAGIPAEHRWSGQSGDAIPEPFQEDDPDARRAAPNGRCSHGAERRAAPGQALSLGSGGNRAWVRNQVDDTTRPGAAISDAAAPVPSPRVLGLHDRNVLRTSVLAATDRPGVRRCFAIDAGAGRAGTDGR